MTKSGKPTLAYRFLQTFFYCNLTYIENWDRTDVHSVYDFYARTFRRGTFIRQYYYASGLFAKGLLGTRAKFLNFSKIFTQFFFLILHYLNVHFYFFTFSIFCIIFFLRLNFFFFSCCNFVFFKCMKLRFFRLCFNKFNKSILTKLRHFSYATQRTNFDPFSNFDTFRTQRREQHESQQLLAYFPMRIFLRKLKLLL